DRLLPVRAERVEVDAAADDHAGGGPPGVRHDLGRPEPALVFPHPGRPGCAGEVALSAAATTGGPDMNILRADFRELYERHLCRHAQLGINVAHLASVAVTYAGVFALAWWLGAPWWLLPAALVPYFVVLAFNVPARVLATTVLFYVLFLPLILLLP